MSIMFGNSIDLHKKSLEYLWKKQEVTLNNIANAETPGYKEKYVTFEETYKSRLDAALHVGDSSYVNDKINSSHYNVVERNTESARLDENSVDLDVQNVELARTALQYQTVLRSVNSDINRLRSVLN